MGGQRVSERGRDEHPDSRVESKTAHSTAGGWELRARRGWTTVGPIGGTISAIGPGEAGRRYLSLFCFFFQAEDGIRALTVTGVQTCALPI